MVDRVVYVALSQFCKDSDEPRRILRDANFKVRENVLARRLLREEMHEALREADAVIAGVELYDANLLASLPRLRCISRCGVGTEMIDLVAAERQGIFVLTTPDEVVEPVAQLTVSMILALARNFPIHYSDSHEGRWRKCTGFLLSEWTIGLIGFGRIGRAVERYLHAFAPRIIVSDPNVKRAELPDSVTPYELFPLLREADLISLHAMRRPEEGPLIGSQELRVMKAGSRLVNTARGHLVDEQALCQAIVSGQLSGAALDVFDTEPYVGPLATLPQVLCTPHVASLTRASRKSMELRCARNVVEFFLRNSPTL